MMRHVWTNSPYLLPNTESIVFHADVLQPMFCRIQLDRLFIGTILRKLTRVDAYGTYWRLSDCPDWTVYWPHPSSCILPLLRLELLNTAPIADWTIVLLLKMDLNKMYLIHVRLWKGAAAYHRNAFVPLLSWGILPTCRLSLMKQDSEVGIRNHLENYIL